MLKTTIYLQFILAAGITNTFAYEDWPPIKLGVNIQSVSNSIDLQTPQKTGLLTFRPPNSNYAGAILGYKWLSGTLSFAVPAKAEIRDLEGVGQYRDLRLSYYNKKLGFELAYNEYKRFILENSQVLSQSTLAGRTFYSLDDMKTQGYGLTFIYNFNPDRHSIAASLDQSDFQSRPAGSPILITTLRIQKLSHSSAIIPLELQPNYGEDATLKGVESFSLALGPGYSFFYPYKRLFASALLGFSLGNQNIDYTLESGVSKNKNSFTSNVHVRVSAGLNDQNFFGFLSFYVDRYQFLTDSLELGSSILGVSFSFGVRF